MNTAPKPPREWPTPRTDADNREYPSPEYAQRIQFEGCGCVVMAPEDYEALYEHARTLERELAEANEQLKSARSQGEHLPVPAQQWRVVREELSDLRAALATAEAALIESRDSLASEAKLAQGWIERCNEAERERDALRAALAPERLIPECCPGGYVCDPQKIADAIRIYCAAALDGGEKEGEP